MEEALREIAVLFIALAPLDVFLGESAGSCRPQRLDLCRRWLDDICDGPVSVESDVCCGRFAAAIGNLAKPLTVDLRLST